jgi:hypothetical protein
MPAVVGVLPGQGIIAATAYPAPVDFELRPFEGGGPRPLAVPRIDPRRYGGHPERFTFGAPDRVAVFRSFDVNPPRAVTIFRLSAPEQALHFPCYMELGDFDATGERFWFSRENKVVIVSTDSGEVIAEHAVGPGENLRPILLDGDRVLFATDTQIEAAPLRGGPRTAVMPRPHKLATFALPARFAWRLPLGSHDAPTGRCVVHFFDAHLRTGGKAVIADFVHEHVVPLPDGALAVGEWAWHVTRAGARRLCKADEVPTFDTPRVTRDGDEVRYWCSQAPGNWIRLTAK